MTRTVIKHPIVKFLFLLPIALSMFKGCVNSLENYYLEWECWLESENPPVQCTAENNYQFTGQYDRVMSGI